MNYIIRSNGSVGLALSYCALVALAYYLFVNVKSEGGESVGIIFLASFFAISSVVFLIRAIFCGAYFRFSFFVFLLFISWLVLRWALDLGDLYWLSQVTVATTGGIVLFFLAGAFFRQGIDEIYLRSFGRLKVRYIFYFSGFLIFALIYGFSDRIRPDIFYLEGIDGAYQRSGNFLSMLFMIFSVSYLYSQMEVVAKNSIACFKKFFDMSFYAIASSFYVACSQLIGSNSATGVILGVFFLVVIVSCFFIIREHSSSRKLYLKSEEVFVSFFLHLCFISVLFVFLLCFFSLLFYLIFDIDFRVFSVFGFSEGELSSLNSRIELFQSSGMEQLSYSPLLGDLNVAYLVTGESGKFIHSLLPFILANLGIFGFFVFIVFLISVVVDQCRDASRAALDSSKSGFFLICRSILFIFIILYLFVFSNISVGISWPVIWFSFGLIAKPFLYREIDNLRVEWGY